MMMREGRAQIETFLDDVLGETTRGRRKMVVVYVTLLDSGILGLIHSPEMGWILDSNPPNTKL
jgi:hypothetical protein